MSRRIVNRKRRPADTVRCAIYTRKSTEEGLDQAFNSLDAQREACEAFIDSQKHEGWVALPEHYDDGGYSGGTLARPALARLLADVAAARIDTIVVYKIDRLTRSLADFTKMVEIFDAKSVSFVAVTQQFNTSTSMGRLTLNVLLSFAQFERELTSERIRDKIAASKKKGMWMGGVPPLGYDIRDRKLIVNETEATTVRHIFDCYAELGSVSLLKGALDVEGVVGKVRIGPTGRQTGGKPFGRGALYRLLQNRIYLGEIVHKEQSHPGQHDAIVEHELWDRVQARLMENRVERDLGTRARNPSLLAGLLFDDASEGMTPSHAVKNGKRYRYYLSRSLTTERRATATSGRRIPAGEIERLVAERILSFLRDRVAVSEFIAKEVADSAGQKQLINRAAMLADAWPEKSPTEKRAVLLALLDSVQVHSDRVDIRLMPKGLTGLLQDGPNGSSRPTAEAGAEHHLTLSVPARLRRVGKEIKMILNGGGPEDRSRNRDPSLVRLIVQAHVLRQQLDGAEGLSLADIAKQQGLGASYFTRVLRLAFLSPEITTAILHGAQPADLTPRRLMNDTRLPLDWREQKAALGLL